MGSRSRNCVIIIVAMKSVIVLLLISALNGSLAVPVNNKDDSLDNYIKAILELLKAGMPTGIPELGIPVLDPFAVPHFDIPHISESGVEADITLDGLAVKNLASFETRTIHADILDLNLQIELFIPLLKAEGIYSLQGSIFGLLPLYGDGDAQLNITGLDAGGFLQVTELELGADFQGISLHLDNLLGGGDFGETINNLLSALAPQLWDLFKDDLFGIINKALVDVINNELKKCTVDEIVNGNCKPKELMMFLKK